MCLHPKSNDFVLYRDVHHQSCWVVREWSGGQDAETVQCSVMIMMDPPPPRLLSVLVRI